MLPEESGNKELWDAGPRRKEKQRRVLRQVKSHAGSRQVDCTEEH